MCTVVQRQVGLVNIKYNMYIRTNYLWTTLITVLSYSPDLEVTVIAVHTNKKTVNQLMPYI